MDQYHSRVPVYDDVSSAGNRFHALARFPDETALVTNTGSYSADRHSGATAMRATFLPGGYNFGGFVFQNGVLPNGTTAPLLNFGTEPNAGFDLTGAESLTFWARGEQGGEVVDFFMGGVGWNGNVVNNPCTPAHQALCPYPDSTPAVRITATLTTQWTQYTIALAGRNLSYVLGGFGWGVNGALNPTGASFLLDDIQYNLSPASRAQRLNQPRFLASFKMLDVQPDIHDPNTDDDIDFVLRSTAFVYDNALALLAFLAHGNADSLRRAALIGDAFVHAAGHDRTFNDGRLRSAYGGGDITLPPGWTPNNRVGTVPVAGFYEDTPQTFFELDEARTFDVGNQAWAMIALLALHQRTGEPRYLDTARNLGEFIRTFRQGAGMYQGFLGGLDYNSGDASPPLVRQYASAEHNLDVHAAFRTMATITGESSWTSDADHARQFVEAMWDESIGCYRPGTIDASLRNELPLQVPLDVQAWSVLALSDGLAAHPRVLRCAETRHGLTADGFRGFDFNDDQDGVWFEGTAHMATAYAWADQWPAAKEYQQELARAQTTPPFGDGFGIAAASHDGVSTGFGFKLFRRLHVGATAWHVFAESGFNPYYQGVAASAGVSPFDTSADGRNDLMLRRTDGSTALWLMNGTNVSAGAVLFGVGTGWQAERTGDVNGDGKSDVFLRRSDGATAIWLMNGLSVSAGGGLFGPGTGWSIDHIADADGDGKSDLILQHPDGSAALWLMNGLAVRGWSDLIGPDTGWHITGVGDFDDDGKSDLVLMHADGRMAVWLMEGGSVRQGAVLTGPATGWRVHLVGDFNGDGKSDLFLQHANGATAIWLMNGLAVSAGAILLGNDTGWHVRDARDFNGDGKSDLVLQHVNGSTALWLMNGTSVTAGSIVLGPGAGWTVAQVVDLNADGKNDLVLAHISGAFAVWLMDGLTAVDGRGLLGPDTGWSPVP